MNEITRNRNVLAVIAAAAVIAGLVLAGAMPKAPVPAPAAAAQSEAAPSGTADSQADGFVVRDYAEFGSGAGAELPSTDWLGLVGGIALKLAFVVGLIYIAMWALRRYVYRDRGAIADKRPVSLLGSLSLSPNRTVYVLEVGRKVIVVGATQNQLSMLTEITDPEAMDELRAQQTEAPLADQFSSLLNAARHQFEKREGPPLDKTIVDAAELKVQEGQQFMQGKLAEVRQSLGRG
ncbi:MAG: flagellar biosynthetic protein FliO [Chloroflexi bacterium]|nr:flagellar biosynthetic protein FliO [Chloroflexota bacterium]